MALVGPSGLLSFPSRRWALRSTAAEAAAAGKPKAECPETNRKCGPRRRGGAGGRRELTGKDPVAASGRCVLQEKQNVSRRGKRRGKMLNA